MFPKQPFIPLFERLFGLRPWFCLRAVELFVSSTFINVVPEALTHTRLIYVSSARFFFFHFFLWCKIFLLLSRNRFATLCKRLDTSAKQKDVRSPCFYISLSRKSLKTNQTKRIHVSQEVRFVFHFIWFGNMLALFPWWLLLCYTTDEWCGKQVLTCLVGFAFAFCFISFPRFHSVLLSK